MVIADVEGEGEGQARVLLVFLSWEPEDTLMPETEKGVKGDSGLFEGESKGLTPLERSQIAPRRGSADFYPQDLTMLSHLPCPSTILVIMRPNTTLETLGIQITPWIHFSVTSHPIDT